MENYFFSKLYNQYYNKVFRYISFVVKNQEVAYDIIQEVFLIAYKRIDELKVHPNAAGFLFQTAKNLANKYKRELYKKLINEVEQDSTYEISDDKNTVESLLDSNINEYEYITDILSQLSEEKYNLYKLYYIDKISMDEIAVKLSLSYSALRMRYVRLRKEIKEMVKKLAEENF